ncbi:hypothetical protein E2C01_067867 [Portunus trituberculatus]|uniref:Uncharacterized protein n=1 Tax=Portunus trituberculatus TaxID=210409 RepID=A0A5B7HYK1_PORTR|nr:hypothetical protein [Portunus trituberculatus]
MRGVRVRVIRGKLRTVEWREERSTAGRWEVKHADGSIDDKMGESSSEKVALLMIGWGSLSSWKACKWRRGRIKT